MEIKHTLSLNEMNNAYNRIINSLCNEDGTIMYQFKDYVMRRAIIEAYTDIRMPDNQDEAYALCYDKDAYTSIMTSINYAQYSDLAGAVASYIRYKEQCLIAAYPYQSMFEEIGTFMNAVNNLDGLSNWLTNKEETEHSPLIEKG